MSNPLGDLLRQSQNQIRNLREKLKKLKEERGEEIPQEKHVPRPPEKKMEEVVMHLSMLSVAKATIVVIGMVLLTNFLGEIADILLIFFVSLLFAAALDPSVDALEKRGIPKAVSVIGIFILVLAFLVFFVSKLIPLIALQLIELARNLNTIVNSGAAGNYPFSGQIQPLLDNFFQEIDKDLVIDQLKSGLDSIGQQLQSLAGNTFGVIKNLFNGIFNFVLILIFTFFLTVDERSVDDFFVSLFPSKHGAYIVDKLELIKHRVGYWLRGQVALMCAMFLVSFILFSILGVKYALTLAMLAGLMEIVPVVGPIIAGIPALLVAFNQSATLSLIVLVALIVLQQIENNVLVPMIMRKAVGLSPIIVMLSMMIGFKTLGVLGAIIAIPVSTCISIFVFDYTTKTK
jgi:predicted PurR-regulated permease PerM